MEWVDDLGVFRVKFFCFIFFGICCGFKIKIYGEWEVGMGR